MSGITFKYYITCLCVNHMHNMSSNLNFKTVLIKNSAPCHTYVETPSPKRNFLRCLQNFLIAKEYKGI